MRCRHPRVRRHDEFKHDDASRGPGLIHKEAKLQAAYSNAVIASCVHGASLPRKVAGRQFSGRSAPGKPAWARGQCAELQGQWAQVRERSTHRLMKAPKLLAALQP